MKKLLGLKDGFTLAEVLITLGIIGVVAAFTIPVLVHDVQENNYKVAYKKAYSVASQAWQSAYADNMLEPRTDWIAETSNYNNFLQFMSKFDVIKTCLGGSGVSNLYPCWAANETSDVWWGAPVSGGCGASAQQICFIDKSGMSWCDNTNWGTIFVDVNGTKTPNQFGLDRFLFYTQVNSGTISTAGVPNSIKPQSDCLNTTNCTDYIHYCPALDKHPCYYTKWLYN